MGSKLRSIIEDKGMFQKHILIVCFFVLFFAIPLNAAEVSRYDLDFEVPVEVKNVVLYRDGGTIGVTLRDGSPRDFEFCFDRSLRTGGDDNQQLVFIGALHWSDKNAKPLKKTSLEEKKIRDVLDKWVKKNATEEERADLVNRQGAAGLTDQEVRVYWILKILKVLWYR